MLDFIVFLLVFAVLIRFVAIIAMMWKVKGIDILPAIVDTDNYHEVNFPFFFTETEDGDYFIPRGTPIAQVLPFKRDDFEMEMRESTHKEGLIQKLLPASKFKEMYKTMFRAKKSYR